MMFRGFSSLMVAALLFMAPALSLSTEAGSQDLVWRKNSTIDAKIESWRLDQLLARISALTGWKVYVEAGLTNPVSVQFKNLAQGEALKLLLGDLNYALVPEAHGAAKLLVFQNGLDTATKLIAPEAGVRGKNWLPNEILLTLKPGSNTNVQDLVKELGGKIVNHSDDLNAYRLQFDSPEAAQKAREKLADNENVGVHDNYEYTHPGGPEIAQGVKPSAAANPSSQAGKPVVIALIDTPIQPLDGKMKDAVISTVHLAGDPGALPDAPTHATSMANAIGDETSNAKIINYDVYGASETTTTWQLYLGMQAAMNATPPPSIINISSGGAGFDPFLEEISEAARQKGILLIGAAGNTPTSTPTYPAASPAFLAITASDGSGNLAPYANRGSFVDMINSGTYYYNFNGATYRSVGTSPAAAGISGQAAELFSKGYSMDQVVQALMQTHAVNFQPSP
jgi:thermitase